jgi:S-adenosylmethionine/arginine decarboxylase-like enzyme
VSRYLGCHWIFDAFGCPRELLSVAVVRSTLTELPGLLALTTVSEAQVFTHRDGEANVVGIILLAESHFSLHVFPRRGVVHGDLFSCKPYDIAAARAAISDRFRSSDIDEEVLERHAPGPPSSGGR